MNRAPRLATWDPGPRTQPLVAGDRLPQCRHVENYKAFLYSQFSHRTLTFCAECASREGIPFIDVVNSTEPTDAELEVAYSIEAHFDRSYRSEHAFDSRGHFHD